MNTPTSIFAAILTIASTAGSASAQSMTVEEDTGFAEAFTHLRTGVPCADKIGLLNVLLAEGLNLGLSKMAEATSTHDYFQLSRISRWHVESDAINRALTMVIKAQSDLPMARFWGSGATVSSDGQFFPASRQGEAPLGRLLCNRLPGNART